MMLFLFSSCNSINNDQLNEEESITVDSVNPENYFVTLKYSDLQANVSSSKKYVGSADVGNKSSVVILRSGGVFCNFSTNSLIKKSDYYTSDGDVAIINGVNEGRMGYNEYLSDNSDTFLSSNITPLNYFDIYDINNGELSQSVPIVFEYDTSAVDTTNQQIVDAGGTNWLFLTESDLGVYKYNKKTGLWEEFNSNVTQNEDQNYFNMNISHEGVFCCAFKQAAMTRLSEYMGQNPVVHNNLLISLTSNKLTEENSVKTAGQQTKEIPYSDFSKEFPSDEENNCSAKVWKIDASSWFSTFNSQCEIHDWCYRYGKNTYGYNKSYCDSQFRNDLLHRCTTFLPNPFDPTIKITLNFGITKVKIRVPNPLYAALELIYVPERIACGVVALAMWGSVELWGNDAYHNGQKDGGCYDYKDSGVSCPDFKNGIITTSNVAPVFPNNATSFYSVLEPHNLSYTYSDEQEIFEASKLIPIMIESGNSQEFYVYIDSNVDSNHAKTVNNTEWSVDDGTAGHFNATTSTTNSITFYADSDAAPGQYMIKATLYGNDGQVMGMFNRPIMISRTSYTYEAIVNTLDKLPDGKYWYVKGPTPTDPSKCNPYARLTGSKAEVLNYYSIHPEHLYCMDVLKKDLTDYSNVSTLRWKAYQPLANYGNNEAFHYFYTTYSSNDPSISCLEGVTSYYNGVSINLPVSMGVISSNSSSEELHKLWGPSYEPLTYFVGYNGRKVVGWLPYLSEKDTLKYKIISAIESAPEGSLFQIFTENTCSPLKPYPFHTYTSSKAEALQWVNNFSNSNSADALARFSIVANPEVQDSGEVPLYKCTICSPLGTQTVCTTNPDNDSFIHTIKYATYYMGYINDITIESDIIGYIHTSQKQNSKPVYDITYEFNGDSFSQKTGEWRVIGYKTKIY